MSKRNNKAIKPNKADHKNQRRFVMYGDANTTREFDRALRDVHWYELDNEEEEQYTIYRNVLYKDYVIDFDYEEFSASQRKWNPMKVSIHHLNIFNQMDIYDQRRFLATLRVRMT